MIDKKKSRTSINAHACEEINDVFIDLYKSGTIYAMAFKKTKDHDQALELVQDTYIRIIENKKHYKKIGKPLGFIKVVMSRIYLNKMRDLDTNTRALNKIREKNRCITDIVDDSLNYVYARQLLSKNFKYKDIIIYLAAGYTAKEIAKILNIPIGTITSRYRHQQIKLRSKYR
jgi:DNA-directed RNA polymerase specialized sigma24 family protein